ncbi:MAG: hypothetical protein JNM57_06945 [Cyclobacteriaceae bacterium]|nr:hypothetical protein [Cyclobacteriaceae bacterium]
MVIQGIRRNTKLISQSVLLFLLLWLIAPVGNAHARLPFKIFKAHAEQVEIHTDAAKDHTNNPSPKNLSADLQRSFSELELCPSCNLVREFLKINSSVRNAFYVTITINAP